MARRQQDRTFVVKVQRSIHSSDGKSAVLVYNAARTRMQQFDMTPETAKLFKGGELKVYHRARMEGTTMRLLERVPDQPW